MSGNKVMSKAERLAAYREPAPVPASVKPEENQVVAEEAVVEESPAEILAPPEVKEPEKKVEEKPKPFMVKAIRPGFFKGQRISTGDKFLVLEHEMGRWMEKI